MQHPDEGTIHGWLDHALARDEALRVEAHVAECAHCAAAVAEARGLIAAASRLLSTLDAADEPRTAPRNGAEGTAREPRIFAEERGSIGVGGELQVAGSEEVGERGGWSVWGRAWGMRVAAVLVVAAVGAVAVREMVGRDASERVAAAPRVGASAAVTAPNGATASPRVTASGRGAMSEGAAVPERATKPEGAPTADRVATPERATARVAAKRAPVRDARDMARTRPAATQAAAAGAAAQSTQADREGRVLAMQRENLIRGRVMSTVGQPVVHALVELRGTRLTTTTNEDGRYALAVPSQLARDRSAVVTVRRIGYQPASRAIALATDTAEHDFALTPSTTSLSEVVVTGMDAFTGRAALADSVAPQRDGATLTLLSRSTLHDRYGRAVRRSVYQVRPGVQVTVDAVRASDDQPPRDGAASHTQRDARVLAPDTTAVPAAPGAGINSIQWTAEDGTRFTLSGPLPLAELRTLTPLVH
jgi:hypothetical protein